MVSLLSCKSYREYYVYKPYFRPSFATRGAAFGDGSLNITYRNVRYITSSTTFMAKSTPASHPKCSRRTGRLCCWMGRRTPLSRKKGCSCMLYRQLKWHPYLVFNDNLVLGLTGIFLFASTTSKSSNILLGWNCGYTFSSTVRYPSNVPCPYSN